MGEDFVGLYDKQGDLKRIGPGDDDLSPEEINILYVAVTRARKLLQLNFQVSRLWRSHN